MRKFDEPEFHSFILNDAAHCRDPLRVELPELRPPGEDEGSSGDSLARAELVQDRQEREGEREG